MTSSDLINLWCFRNHRMQLAHFESARHYARFDLILGSPQILFSAITGTAVFAAVSKPDFLGVRDDHRLLVQVVCGALSVVSPVLASLLTFLKNSEHAEKHRLAAARHASLKQRIELLASIPPATKEQLEKALSIIEVGYKKLTEESPTLWAAIWKRIDEEITFEVFQSRFPYMGADRTCCPS